MHKYKISLIFLLSAHTAVLGKSLFTYNVNPERDLEGAGATSFASFWQNSNYGSSHYHTRHKNHDDGYFYGHPTHPHFGSEHDFPDIFDFDSAEYGNNYHYNHQHGGHGRPQRPTYPQHTGHPTHPNHGYNPYGPPRFPPPPVYDNDFINPWGGKTPQGTTTTTVTIMPTTPKTTTTTTTKQTTKTTTKATIAPTVESSTTNADGLIYDIDLRFGQK